MATTNWDAIRTEYVTGEISLRQLAEKHEVATSTLIEHSTNEGWESERSQFRVKTAQKMQEKALEANVNALTQADQLADSIIARYLERLQRQVPTGTEAIAAAKLRLLLSGFDPERGSSTVPADWQGRLRSAGASDAFIEGLREDAKALAKELEEAKKGDK